MLSVFVSMTQGCEKIISGSSMRAIVMSAIVASAFLATGTALAQGAPTGLRGTIVAFSGDTLKVHTSY